jgi:hypothetical protein
VLGETTVREWQESIRDRPGPWAELESDQIVLTVPSEEARRVDDPERVLRLWGRVLDAMTELSGRDAPRRPERFVFDRQISGGLMHSGYPIMSYAQWQDDLPTYSWQALDTELIVREGLLGHWHELGHNRQRPPWTFEGCGELTCNLFYFYACDVVCGRGAWESWRIAPEDLEEYLGRPADFERFKGHGVSVLFWTEVVREFGWQPFKDLFREWAARPEEELPQDDDGRRDEYFVALSGRLGRNLAEHFDRWGVPISDGARARVADLPAWAAAEWPPRPPAPPSAAAPSDDVGSG